jgi:1-deoxyxylulose-5-phosphate synthase
MQHATIGLGCVTFGREIDAETAFGLIDHAVTNGITLLDTAAAYGGGASEKIVGEWLAARPEHKHRVSIGTKILPPYNAIQIEKSVKESLSRLQLDSVEVLYLHRWDDTLLEPSAWQALSKLLQAGAIKKFGIVISIIRNLCWHCRWLPKPM